MTETIETINNRQFLPRHVWVRVDSYGLLEIGVTSSGIEALDGIAYADLPAVGSETVADTTLLILEGRKAVEEMKSPANGVVVYVEPDALDDGFKMVCVEQPLVRLKNWTMPTAIVNQLRNEELP